MGQPCPYIYPSDPLPSPHDSPNSTYIEKDKKMFMGQPVIPHILHKVRV